MKILKTIVLKSETHTSQFVATFSDLLINNTLTDVTLVCDDRYRIEAHKLVLCAGSSMFRQFFENNSHSHPMIFLKGIKEHQLESVVQFLYYGETRIAEDILNDFIAAAKDLEVLGLDIDSEEIFEEDVDVKPQIQDTLDHRNLNPSESEPVNDDDLQKMTQNTFIQIEPQISPKKATSLESSTCNSGLTEEILERPSGIQKQFDDFDSDIRTVTRFKFVPGTKKLKLKDGDDLKIGCIDCDFITKHFGDYFDHYKKIHHFNSNHKPDFKCRCTECNKVFSSYGALKRHSNSMHNVVNSFQCRKCSYVTGRNDNLKSHMVSEHESISAYNCMQCSFKTIRPKRLRDHMYAKHKSYPEIH